jgi:pimeloyl-ACP methyl ester carboxylesterase
MCHFRPLAVAAAPWLIRGLPRAVAADSARHTWPSYSRTLSEVVAGHPIAADLLRSEIPVTFLHGTKDPIADPARAEALAATLDSSRQVEFRSVDFRYVDCDHHLPLKHPDAVVAAIAAA